MMARKKLIIIFLLLASAYTPAAARNPAEWFLGRFRLGLEWGYSQCLLLNRDYNIISSEGYRIYEKDFGFYLQPNGLLLGRVAYPFLDHFEVALCSGYIGSGQDNRLFPLLMRLSWFPSGTGEDGFFTTLQGGVAWHTPASGGSARQAWLASGGEGYRIRLGAGLDLDLTVGFRFLADHPLIPNPEGPGNVAERNIRKNIAEYCALDFSMSVSF